MSFAPECSEGRARIHVRQYLFAYGTLLGGVREPQVRSVLQRYCRLGPRASVGGRLVDLGAYPGALKPDRPEQRIHGRLIELLSPQRVLPVLDAYEDCRPDRPARGLYRRERVVAQLATGGSVHCWIYRLVRRPRKGRPVPGGDWPAWLSQQRPQDR